MSQQVEAQRVSDGALLRLAAAIAAIDEEFKYSFSAFNGHAVKLSQLDEDDSAFGYNTFFIMEGKLAAEGSSFELEYRRGQVYGATPSGHWAWRPATSAFIDGFKISGPKRNVEEIARALAANVTFAPPGTLTMPSDAMDHTELMLKRVTDAAAIVVEHTAKRQSELDALRQHLEQAADARIDAERQRLEEEHADRMDALAERERDFADKISGFDDRANMHVRRQLQGSMAKLSTDILSRPLLEASHQSFVLTEVVAIAFAAILIALAAVQSALLTTEHPGGALLWFGEARVVLLGLGAGALVWYALRQSTTRHRQVSRWENDLNRFRLDTERASFLIEGDLEARKISDAGLPEVMLDRFSRGLFTGGSHEASHEGDDVGTALGHLLNRAALVKVGTDGLNVEVKGSGIRKAQKDADKEASADDE